MSWKEYKLKEICSNIIDCVNKTAPTTDEETPYKMLRTTNIRNGIICEDDVKYVTKETFDIWTRRGTLKKGDILFTREAPLGEVGIVKNPENFFLGQRIVLFRVNSNICDNRFILYSLLYRENKESIIAKGVGSTVQHLRVPECENITLKIPDLAIQRKIADTLSAYDELIENNNKQIKLLEEAAQRLYKEWFIDLRFPGHESTKIVDGVPEGWEKSRVCNVISIIRRGISPKYSENGTSFVINQKCIRSTIMDISNARRQEKKFIKEMNLRDEDIVICSTGSGTLGRVGKVFGEYKNTTFDSHITLIRASQGIGKEYLFHTIKTKQKYLQESGKGSTNQLELKKTSIEDISIFIPKKDIYDKFETIAYNIHKKITSLSLTINYLKKQKMILLSNFFTKI